MTPEETADLILKRAQAMDVFASGDYPPGLRKIICATVRDSLKESRRNGLREGLKTLCGVGSITEHGIREIEKALDSHE